MPRTVIIGAGHNGLVCAAYLAAAKHQVTVVERAPVPGGCTFTEEIFPGYRFNTGAIELEGMVHSGVDRELRPGELRASVDSHRTSSRRATSATAQPCSIATFQRRWTDFEENLVTKRPRSGNASPPLRCRDVCSRLAAACEGDPGAGWNYRYSWQAGRLDGDAGRA